MGTLFIGTSGWSYPHWKGNFYPEDLKSSELLSYYAGKLNATEINNSFYRQTPTSTVERWLQQVPPDFYFCPKMSRYLSHAKKLNEPEEPLRRFFESYRLMKDQMGPVLIQLPTNVAFRKDKAESFFSTLRSDYADYSFALEARHHSWFEKESVALMEKFNIAFVLAHSGFYPYQEIITAHDVYLRLHGPDALYASSYNEEELRYFAEKIQSWRLQGHDVWVFFNNDVHGFAPINALELRQYLKA